MLFPKLALVGYIIFSQAKASSNQEDNKVLLTSIKGITVHAGQWTTYRRTAAIPQLHCSGGDAEGLYEVQSMQCRARYTAYDGDDPQWTCTADMPDYFKLGSTQVHCEGYDYPVDTYILKGSCGVEYRLMLTEKGVEKYGYGKHRETTVIVHKMEDKDWDVGAFIFGIVFAVVSYIIISGIIRQWRQNRAEQRQNLPGTNQGPDGNRAPPPHFDDGNEEPPPPYDDDDDDDQGQDFPGKKSSDKSSKVQSSTELYRQGTEVGSSRNVFQRQGAGIATGAAVAAGVGAAAAVAAHASRSSTETQPAVETRERNAPRVRTNIYINTSESSSSQMHESIGFGGTTRR